MPVWWMVIADFRSYYNIDLEGMLDLGWREFITLLIGLGAETRWQQWRTHLKREEDKNPQTGSDEPIAALIQLTSIPGQVM